MKASLPIAAATFATLAGCETSGTNTAGALGDIPPAAIEACSIRADDFQTAAPGTSVVNAAQPIRDGNWQLRMGTGNLRSTCTVSPTGRVISIAPG
ncbi:MAG: hypothetical protein ABWY13_00040 [Mesorhizobium sp.]|jgi:hypothetical protein|nr:hypothetical protein [Mesorhizobium sp.]